MWQHFARKSSSSILRSRPSGVSVIQRSFVSRTLAVGFAAKTINVPTMGDSITEVRVCALKEREREIMQESFLDELFFDIITHIHA